jgi:FkbM family methyltransferase
MYLSNSRAPSLAFTLALILDRYETGTTSLFERALKSGMTVIDIGAHAGYYALLAARLVGSQGRVFAFEPDPANCQLLQKNVSLNSYANIAICPRAVAERSGRSRLLLDPRGNDRNALIQDTERTNGVESKYSTEVETISVDDFLEETRVEGVDLLKIDAEGAECGILRGMSRALSRAAVQRMIMEFCPVACEQDGITPEALLRRIVDYGLAIYCIGRTGDTTPVRETQFDSLIEDARKKGSTNLFVAYPEAS